jgi:hypothetical protein
LSRENIELHERIVVALNARDVSDELAAKILAPDFRSENGVAPWAGCAICSDA